jgi:anti-sigma regulatory factor (Ser/Thr protein kinase)
VPFGGGLAGHRLVRADTTRESCVLEGRDRATSSDRADTDAADAGNARRVSVRLRPTRTAAEQARRALRQLPLPSPLADEAQLLVTELVTNSVRHAGLSPYDRIHLTADWSGTWLRVDVRDRAGAGAASAATGSNRPSPGAESGWGLYLVDRLASRWGSTADGYWFELRCEPREPGA